MKEVFGTFFLVLSSVASGKPQGTVYNGPQAVLTITLEVGRVDRAFF